MLHFLSVLRRGPVGVLGCLALAVLGIGFSGPARAAEQAPVRVLPAGELPDDQRLGALKDLDGYFPFQVPESLEAWNKRSQAVRRQVLVAMGLWPAPARPSVEAVIHGKADRDDYTVEKVYFESTPGLYVTGSLYRPKGQTGPRPAVLCPHGHWADGRFYDAGEGGVKNAIATGAEKFEVGGRYPLQARCVQLARMGCVVFHYDMLGYADSVPITYQQAHRFAKQVPELNQPDHWGLFSAQSELRLLNVMGLQTLNSLRAFDFVAGLQDVDPKRIGVTGASGGGTQTFILSAVEPRIAAAFPAVMVSTAMQGGCTCENATYLRIGTGNIELAALTAPRPLGMSAANDWTKEIETKGLPELERLYQLYGHPERVAGKHFPFPHNYNAQSRAMMYDFFNQHLNLKQKTPIVEEDYVPLTVEEMSVWNIKRHPKPATDEAAELKLLRSMDELSNGQIAALVPTGAPKQLADYRRVIGGALEVMIGRALPDAKDVESQRSQTLSREGFHEHCVLVRLKTQGEELPAILLRPANGNGEVAVWVHEDGKAGLFEAEGKPIAPVKQLLDAGTTVLTADLFYQGEFLKDGQKLTETRRVKNPREFAGFTLGYNHPLFSQRVHDVLTLMAFVKKSNGQLQKMHLVGQGEAAPWVICAAALAGDAVDKVAVDTKGFRFASLTDVRDPQLLPGAVKYGDLPGLLALCAPHPVYLAGEKGQVPGVVQSVYQAAGAEKAITAPASTDPAALIQWLLK